MPLKIFSVLVHQVRCWSEVICFSFPAITGKSFTLQHDNITFIRRCDILDILLEMDRILRPEGAAIIRDHADVIWKVERAAEQLSWQSRIVNSEGGPFDPEKLLIVDNSVAALVKQK